MHHHIQDGKTKSKLYLWSKLTKTFILYHNREIATMSGVFANDPGDQGSIPG